MKAEDLGLAIGVVIMVLFGSFFTFVIPRYIERSESTARGQADGKRMARWVRILGWIVLGVAIIQLIVFFFFNHVEA